MAALTAPNRLAMELSLALGLRIGDVLALKTEQLAKCNQRRITICEQKTGKRRRVQFPLDLYTRALGQAGRCFVFEHRKDWRQHRTRQAVWADLKRVARLYRCDTYAKQPNIAPHSARKAWAVGQYQKSGLKRTQALLNHSGEAVTMLYAMADQLTERKLGLKK